MNKKELIENMSLITNISKIKMSKVIDSLESLIIDVILKGEIINLKGFGKIFTAEMAKKHYYNFFSGELCECPSKVVPRVKFSKNILKK